MSGASRGAGAHSVALKSIGCGLDPHWWSLLFSSGTKKENSSSLKYNMYCKDDEFSINVQKYQKSPIKQYKLKLPIYKIHNIPIYNI